MVWRSAQTIDNRLPKLEKEARRVPEAAEQLKAVQAARSILDDGRTVISAAAQLDLVALDDLHLLTAKPFVYVFNVDEADLEDAERLDALRALVAPAPAIVLCAQLEADLASLEGEDLAEMLSSYGLAEPGLDRLVRLGFETLGLQTYLTAGPKESRAWTIHKGDTAPKAAGVIHTDFERGFIKAEVISFADLLAAGSVAGAKAAGKVRLEGKDYVMQDGDVVEFRFNV